MSEKDDSIKFVTLIEAQHRIFAAQLNLIVSFSYIIIWSLYRIINFKSYYEEITINNFYNNVWFVYLILSVFLLTLSIIHLNNNMNIKKDLLKPCEETTT